MAAGTSTAQHPRDILLGSQAGQCAVLPVCDHYSGAPARMKKSLELQAQMAQEFGACVFDVTLDCEDGAAVGGEAEHAALVAALVCGAAPGLRVAARVHPVDHPAFANDMATIAGEAGQRLCHIMVPKVESLDDVLVAERALERASAAHLPLHVLIESPLAVQRALKLPRTRVCKV
jgi:citrate lyase subunit beta/citryl-CoA lyase